MVHITVAEANLAEMEGKMEKVSPLPTNLGERRGTGLLQQRPCREK